MLIHYVPSDWPWGAEKEDVITCERRMRCPALHRFPQASATNSERAFVAGLSRHMIRFPNLGFIISTM